MISIKEIDALREEIISSDMSAKRRDHTLAVEKMAVMIGEIYAPDKLLVLRAAALLHDITKEYTKEQHVELMIANGCEPTRLELLAPKTLHAKTAAMLIPKKYPSLADGEVISAVRWHTTGRAGMTVTEKIVYLADYIDETRKFDDCVRLREMFWSKEPQKMTESEKTEHMREVMIASFKMTVAGLLEGDSPISPDTADALNYEICEKYR